MTLDLKKLLYEELLETSFPIKKIKYIHFRHQPPPSLQEGLGPPERVFRHFLRKYSFLFIYFFGKTVK